MSARWVCIDCGARQEAEGACVKCRRDATLDTQSAQVRELMYDVDLRRQQKAETRARMIGVGVGMASVIALWMVPGYWDLRGRLYPGLPGLLDQWALMAVLGFLISKVLEKKLFSKRFPYLDDNQQIVG